MTLSKRRTFQKNVEDRHHCWKSPPRTKRSNASHINDPWLAKFSPRPPCVRDHTDGTTRTTFS